MIPIYFKTSTYALPSRGSMAIMLDSAHKQSRHEPWCRVPRSCSLCLLLQLIPVDAIFWPHFLRYWYSSDGICTACGYWLEKTPIKQCLASRNVSNSIGVTKGTLKNYLMNSEAWNLRSYINLVQDGCCMLRLLESGIISALPKPSSVNTTITQQSVNSSTRVICSICPTHSVGTIYVSKRGTPGIYDLKSTIATNRMACSTNPTFSSPNEGRPLLHDFNISVVTESYSVAGQSLYRSFFIWSMANMKADHSRAEGVAAQLRATRRGLVAIAVALRCSNVQALVLIGVLAYNFLAMNAVGVILLNSESQQVTWEVFRKHTQSARATSSWIATV